MYLYKTTTFPHQPLRSISKVAVLHRFYCIANSEQSSHTPCHSYQSMLNHNFIDANFPMYCMGVMGKKKKNLTILFFSYTKNFTMVRVYTKFEDFGSNSRWEICDGFLWERKKNGQIKRMTSMRMLLLSYAIQLLIPNICTKFQNPSWNSSWKICNEKFKKKRKMEK